MNVSVAPIAFRPITIVLETQDEADMLYSILRSVADNRINHTPPVMKAAQNFIEIITEEGGFENE